MISLRDIVLKMQNVCENKKITIRVEDGSFSVKKNSCNASTRSAILSTYGKSKKERVAGISSLRQVR